MNILKRVIVAGATGFIGKHLIENLIKNNIEVYALVRYETREKHRFINNENIKYIEVDPDHILDVKSKFPIEKYDAFFCLSWSGVTGDKRSNYKMQLKNVELTLDFLKLASELKCDKFIGSSSISEIECNLFAPCDDAKLGLRFIYSSAKMASHYMSKCLSLNWGIAYINANIGNVFGENGSDNLLLHDTIIKLLKSDKTSFTDGNQIYDFIYIQDLINGLVKLAESGRANCSYYIGSGKPRPLKEYLQQIGDIICPNQNIGLGLNEADGMSLPIEVFDITKIQTHTGFVPEFSYEESIIKTIGWYKEKLGIM